MNKLTYCSIIVCLSISAGTLAADGTITAQKAVLSTVDDKSAVEQSDKAVANTNCISQTGSRLNSKDKSGCNGLPGRSYTKADIDLTGATTLAEALQRLDPAIQIGR